MRNADEFNLLTWVAWLLSQVTALFYSLALHSLAYLVVNVLWITFYATMIALIMKFRKGATTKLVLQEDDQV